MSNLFQETAAWYNETHTAEQGKNYT